MAKNSIADWSTTPLSNSDIASISLAETVTKPSDVNNFERAHMAQIAALNNDFTGTGQTVAGTVNALTITVNQPWLTLAGNQQFLFKNTVGANTGAATIAVTNSLSTSLGSKAIRLQGDSALVGGEMVANGYYLLTYDTSYNSSSGAWVLVNPTVPPSGAIKKINVVKITSSGTYTPSANLVGASVDLQAAGGSAGGIQATSSSQITASLGGSAGGRSRRYLTAAQIGSSQAVTIGAAGAAPTAGLNNGNAAGNSSFGALLTANGGNGGNAGSAVTNVNLDGVLGGTAASGDENWQGGPSGNVTGSNSPVVVQGSKGGDSPMGHFGGRPRVNANGDAGNGYGSGGGGVIAGPSLGAAAGGAGAPAICIITEYLSA